MSDSLPSCPCGSGKLYEQCCYNVALPDGGRRFFQGLMTGDSEGRWHPIPNQRLKMVVIGEVLDDHRKAALDFSSASKLSEAYKWKLVDAVAGFMKAYSDLKTYLAKPQARGASTSMKSTELDGLWWNYLSLGRRLLDFAGLHSRTALGHKTDIGGLNRKKLKVLKLALYRDPRFAEVLRMVESVELTLMDLIDVRDEEKLQGGTIRTAPVISPEGESTGGVVRIDRSAKELDCCLFLDQSYGATLRFVAAVLDLQGATSRPAG